MMIVVPPRPLQKASWFFELSRVPFSITVICRRTRPDRRDDDVVAFGPAKNRLIGLLIAGDVGDQEAGDAQRRGPRRHASTLPGLRRRRAGLWRRGKSCAAGGSLANDWPVVLCREKFTEGLPFVVRQDADVAINNQSIRLISLPAVGQGEHGR